MERVEIIISDKILDNIVKAPDKEDEDSIYEQLEEKHTFPQDKKILKIVKEIMDGKVADSPEDIEIPAPKPKKKTSTTPKTSTTRRKNTRGKKNGPSEEDDPKDRF